MTGRRSSTPLRLAGKRRDVGPCSWDPPIEPPAWLAELEHPVVLVTTSSEFQDDGRLVQASLEALADEPVAVVATLPADGHHAGFTVPANARLQRFVPHGPLLERPVRVMTHGGMGATQKALVHGVPVCAVPFGRDQLGSPGGRGGGRLNSRASDTSAAGPAARPNPRGGDEGRCCQTNRRGVRGQEREWCQGRAVS